MQFKIDPFAMSCIWMSQFPYFYLEQYLERHDIYPKVIALMIMNRITPEQGANILEYARENNVL